MYSGIVYNVGKKWHPVATCRVAEWTGDGGAVVVGTNPDSSLFFLFRFQKNSKFFDGLVSSTRSRKFPVLVS